MTIQERKVVDCFANIKLSIGQSVYYLGLLATVASIVGMLVMLLMTDDCMNLLYVLFSI